MAIIKEMNIRFSSVIENLSPTGLTEGEAEKTEICAEGFYYIHDDRYEISFREETEGGAVFSDITVRDTEITLKRRGAIVSDMRFAEGECDRSLYQVPPYSFDTEIRTKKIRNGLTRDGGSVAIFYEMKIGGADKSVRMKIECRA
jgi:uncharacterized beta-barrel protein YwiB (DUF1934 family)